MFVSRRQSLSSKTPGLPCRTMTFTHDSCSAQPPTLSQIQRSSPHRLFFKLATVSWLIQAIFLFASC